MNDPINAGDLGSRFLTFIKANNLPMPKFWYGDVVVESMFEDEQKYIVYGIVYVPSTQQLQQWEYLCAYSDDDDFETSTFYQEQLELFKEQN